MRDLLYKLLEHPPCSPNEEVIFIINCYIKGFSEFFFYFRGNYTKEEMYFESLTFQVAWKPGNQKLTLQKDKTRFLFKSTY